MYRKGSAYENLEKANFIGDGAYDIPIIRPVNISVNNFIGFNYAKTCKASEDTSLHFFIDDYQFSRLWTNPNQYLSLISKFNCVCTPDFSTYTDYPKIIQIYNHFRKHWLGAYWQANGVTVIPTISWSDESSFEWCFDGEPRQSGVMSIEAGIDELYGDSKDDEWKAEEAKRIKEEMGIAVAEETSEADDIPIGF